MHDMIEGFERKIGQLKQKYNQTHKHNVKLRRIIYESRTKKKMPKLRKNKKSRYIHNKYFKRLFFQKKKMLINTVRIYGFSVLTFRQRRHGNINKGAQKYNIFEQFLSVI